MGVEEEETWLSWLLWLAQTAACLGVLSVLFLCVACGIVFVLLKIIARRVRQSNAKSGELTVSWPEIFFAGMNASDI